MLVNPLTRIRPLLGRVLLLVAVTVKVMEAPAVPLVSATVWIVATPGVNRVGSGPV